MRALWLSPFNTNPKGAYLASDGFHNVTGYHGYWPTKGREVEPRLGGDAALKSMVKAAHAHGIRVLQDFVINHVHQEHEYFKAHPEWFHRLRVRHQQLRLDGAPPRLPVHELPARTSTGRTPTRRKQFEDDAVWWLDTFDLDGLRIDAVKHVPDAAMMNVSTAVRREFEASGTRVFLTGETAMGWSDCDLAATSGSTTPSATTSRPFRRSTGSSISCCITRSRCRRSRTTRTG